MNRAKLAAAPLCVVSIAVGLLPQPAYSAEASFPRFLAMAEELVMHVRPENSSYQHSHGVLHLRGQNGAARYDCHTDCSGLLNNLLEHAYDLSDDDLQEWLGTRRPTAKTYHRAIAERNGFERVARVDDLRPGDVIVVRYPVGSENTGHLMIVDQAARPRHASAPRVAGTQQWEVGVIDSSMSGHGPRDTRCDRRGNSRDGIGRGLLRLYTDARGAIVGHSWSTRRSSKFQDHGSRPVQLGRLMFNAETPWGSGDLLLDPATRIAARRP